MRVIGIALLSLMVAAAAWGLPPSPYLGSAEGNGFIVAVVDEDIDAAWELVTGAAEWSPMTADTTVTAAYTNLSYLDSLRGGNAGAGALTAIYCASTTADSSANNNFLQSRNTGTVASKAAVFGSGFSPRYNAYLTRRADTDYKLGALWTIACWVKGLSAGNPAVGKPQAIWSLFHSPQAMRLQFDAKTGHVSGRVTDDGYATKDSVKVAVDLYDSTYHWIRFSGGASYIRLEVDRYARSSAATTNAKSTMNGVDTLTILSGRGGTKPLRGMVDELYDIEDTTSLYGPRGTYPHERYAGKDSAYVRITGIRRADSTHVYRMLKVPATAAVVDSTKLHAWEWAYVDTSETQSILLYQTGTTPRQAKLDSIPANLRHEPVAHALFGANETPRIQSITFLNYGAAAVTYEARLYADVMDSVRYDQQYSVLAAAYIPSGGGPDTFEFANGGLDLPPGSYVAVMALGGGANCKGGCLIQGQRRGKR